MSLLDNRPGATVNPPSVPTTSRRAVLRSMTIGGVLTVFPALLGCAPSSTRSLSPETIELAPHAVIMVIRHGEKPDKSQPVVGIDLSGRSDRHSLTVRGWTRADYLVNLFTQDDSGRPSLPAPEAIYASGHGSRDGEGTRPRQTVGPLAAALGIPVNTSFSRGQEAALADDAARQPGPSLICWQHESIPAIATALRPTTPSPPSVWPDDRYDVAWTFTPADTGWSFAQVPELLLPGDSPTGLG